MSRTCQEFIFEAIQLQGIAEVLTRNAWRSQPPVGSWEQRELAPRKLHGTSNHAAVAPTPIRHDIGEPGPSVRSESMAFRE